MLGLIEIDRVTERSSKVEFARPTTTTTTPPGDHHIVTTNNKDLELVALDRQSELVLQTFHSSCTHAWRSIRYAKKFEACHKAYYNLYHFINVPIPLTRRITRTCFLYCNHRNNNKTPLLRIKPPLPLPLQRDFCIVSSRRIPKQIFPLLHQRLVHRVRLWCVSPALRVHNPRKLDHTTSSGAPS